MKKVLLTTLILFSLAVCIRVLLFNHCKFFVMHLMMK